MAAPRAAILPLLWPCLVAACSAESPAMLDLTAVPGDLRAAMDSGGPCLTPLEADLLQVVRDAPFAPRSGGPLMTLAPRAEAPWRAARGAALAWAAADCAGFQAAARDMGYEARALRDTATGREHWLLRDASGRYNGVFLFRDPVERAAARPLVIDSPHLGFDFSDDRAARAYRDLDAVAFLQNTAHRCNLPDLSGCSAVSSYACGDGGVRASDVVHSVDQLYFAVYDGLEAARGDLHFEYHGAAATANAAGCSGTAHLSQASSQKLGAADDGTYPNRVWQALSRRLGDACACYHQREDGCLLNGAASTPGRRTNEEAMMGNVDVCTQSPPRLAGRFVHMEQYNVPVEVVIAALAEAVPR